MTLRKTSILLKHIWYIAAIIIIWLTYLLLGVGCPIYALFGIRCPTCGVTRALFALFESNWELYFDMNPFAILISVAAVVSIHLSVISSKYRKYSFLDVVITVVSNFCWYISTLI